MKKGRKKAIPTDKKREHRILMEIVVDACGEHERAMGWYRYLQEKLSFPFITSCIARRAISPLEIGDEVEVIGLAPEEERKHEIFVMMRWERHGLAIPLSQLKIGYANEQTREAVEDWHYWVRKEYQF